MLPFHYLGQQVADVPPEVNDILEDLPQLFNSAISLISKNNTFDTKRDMTIQVLSETQALKLLKFAKATKHAAGNVSVEMHGSKGDSAALLAAFGRAVIQEMRDFVARAGVLQVALVTLICMYVVSRWALYFKLRKARRLRTHYPSDLGDCLLFVIFLCLCSLGAVFYLILMTPELPCFVYWPLSAISYVTAFVDMAMLICIVSGAWDCKVHLPMEETSKGKFAEGKISFDGDNGGAYTDEKQVFGDENV